MRAKILDAFQKMSFYVSLFLQMQFESVAVYIFSLCNMQPTKLVQSIEKINVSCKKLNLTLACSFLERV